jgi:predicted dinucleotide-binding enzyme
MKVGILGSGDVGQALGRGFARHGWDVTLGTRDASKLADWQAETKQKAGSFADAARHGDVVILALHGAGVENALDLAGPASFAGKLVLDTTNPLDFSEGNLPGLFVGTTDSLAERIQRKLPQAKVVKCFNTVSNAQMVDPKFRDGTPPMMIAGNDADAKKQTEALLRDLGWPGVLDVGGLDAARWLEALVPLWVRVAVARGGAWGHAFKSVD